jgi:uncharacterized protein (DUF1684 family)
MASARDYVDLADYRRRVQAIYADVRARYATDPRDAHARWRAARDDLFGRHPQSALTPERRVAFGGLRYYPYDPGLVFEAEVVPAVDEAPAPTLDVPMGTAHPIGCRRIGRIELSIGRLDLFWVEDYAGGLFLPFRDGTAGTGTYGGGRYLLDTAKGADLGTTPAGRLRLDFNFAYHPSCHYSDRWACPLAPPSNRLAASIEAGERRYEGP